MSRGVRWYLIGGLALLTLAGCGRSFMQYAQREPWRRDAELACMQAGVVKEGLGVVRIAPIEGPGICGATIPLQVALLGESSTFGYADEAIRPPGAIPGAQPRWPVAPPRYSAPPVVTQPIPPAATQPPPQVGAPLSISPPGIDANSPTTAPRYQWQTGPSPAVPPSYRASPNYPSVPQPEPQEELPDYDDAPVQTRPSAPPPRYTPPALGPQRTPVAATPVELKPNATLACPIVSALDRWIVQAVQPAAQKWFGQPVVEIRQISAYSCRGMNGQIGARISEHAFGNALDIAAFVLANGHRITVKDGWRGAPEEQGFLRDVQAAACDQFTTVLAPGSNRFHYDHIHVDLMRRASGRRICQPGAVDGELIAARARQNSTRYAVRQEPPPTRVYDPPFDARNDPFAWRGDSTRRDVTGSVARNRAALPPNAVAEDLDWIEDDSPRPAIVWGPDRFKPH